MLPAPLPSCDDFQISGLPFFVVRESAESARGVTEYLSFL